MFSKKFLCTVAFLFIGSQFKIVNATNNACEFSDVSNSACSVTSCGAGEQNMYYAVYSNAAIYTSDPNLGSATLVKVNAAGNGCDPVTDKIGIFKTTLANGDAAYITRNHSGTISFLDDFASGSCVDGKLTSEGNLCISATFSEAITLTSGKNYLAKNAYSTFTSTESDLVATKYDGYSIIKDETITGDIEYCVSSTTNEITEKLKNYCDTTVTCDKYYECTTGICTDKTTNFAVRRGACEPLTKTGCDVENYGDYYYIGNANNLDASTLGAALVTTAGETGHLYKCVLSGSATACTLVDNSAGYFLNIDGSSNIKYIQCTVATRTTTTCIGLMDAPSTGVTDCSGDAGSVFLDGDNYKTCVGTTTDGATQLVAKSATIQITSTCTSNGELIKDGGAYKICIKKADNTLAAVAFQSGATTVSYFVDSGNTSVFNADVLTSHFVVVDINAKTAVVDQGNTPKKYRYAITATRQIIEKEDANSNDMCTSGSLKTATGHEFAMTKSSPDNDKVNYYKDNTSA